MKRHTVTFFVLVAAQAICLALGLWLQARFRAYSAGRDTETILPRQLDDASVGPPQSAELGSMDNTAGSEDSGPALSILAFLWIGGLQTIVAYLILSRIQADTSQSQLQGARESLQRQNDLIRTRDAVIFGLAKLAESRDPETGNHLERIALYSTRLAAALHHDPRYRHRVTAPFVKLIGISSALHDIGKVGVPDSILLKPGKLNDDEWLAMQLHAAIGGKCIGEIALRLGSSNFLQMAREIAFSHHERWDGTGYPRGLAGEEIPLAARIVAVADVYDALSTKRVYKEAYPHERCVAIISDEAGKQFDPTLVDVFMQLESEFRAIAQRCRDAAEVVGNEPPRAEQQPQSPGAAVVASQGSAVDSQPVPAPDASQTVAAGP
ncbi:MAG: HD-GYP domain-containing protein [Planctomycetota bacterium]|jgi:HD-GYP domain-containing protein (c-di-GMP phosphodiesterase class II)